MVLQFCSNEFDFTLIQMFSVGSYCYQYSSSIDSSSNERAQSEGKIVFSPFFLLFWFLIRVQTLFLSFRSLIRQHWEQYLYGRYNISGVFVSSVFMIKYLQRNSYYLNHVSCIDDLILVTCKWTFWILLHMKSHGCNLEVEQKNLYIYFMARCCCKQLRICYCH